jgi:hypothetical protein
MTLPLILRLLQSVAGSVAIGRAVRDAPFSIRFMSWRVVKGLARFCEGERRSAGVRRRKMLQRDL